MGKGRGRVKGVERGFLGDGEMVRWILGDLEDLEEEKDRLEVSDHFEE